jgi:acetoin utilization protein AcuC
VSPDSPLLVYGPRSTTYDFGPSHPLTPRRFGPGIELLEALGAVAGLAPVPANDAILEWAHEPGYIEIVKAFSADPSRPSRAGIGPGDTPAFAGIHEASAAVAGGSVAAMESILRGETDHVFHPGGGLHHAMPDRASGFCVYNDPALAVARARRDGLRVLYIDLDVHHGDGVQAIHWSDPGVMTFSIHESGFSLFPGGGFTDERGGDDAVRTKFNLPLEAGTGERGWLAAIQRVLPELAARFRPEIVVSQHGADAHAFDPLAHLNVTTTAMGEAARLVDRIAHEWAGGRWLATGGGGYDIYAVVPRVWGLVWLAGAHRDVPTEIPEAWRRRWVGDAKRTGRRTPPATFTDPPNAGQPYDSRQDRADRRAIETAEEILGGLR